MEIKKQKFYDYYTDTTKESDMILGSKMEFLEERNKGYMNYTAFSFDGMKDNITFEEFHQRVDEYARALYNRGIRKGDRIGVCLVNTPEAAFTLYALDKIGAEIIGLSPLNNKYKMQRDIEMTRPKMIITVDKLYKKSRRACHTMDISPIIYSPISSIDNEKIKKLYDMQQFVVGNRKIGSQYRLERVVENGKGLPYIEQEYIPGEMSDVIFTGGSTGVHKGVMLTSDGLNGVVQGVDSVFILEPGMKHLGNIPFGHMVFGRFVLHYVLAKNMEYALTLNAFPNEFVSELIRTQADGAMGGPVHWRNFINNPLIKKGCMNLKQAISGGEMLKDADYNDIQSAFSLAGLDIELGDGLGLTEMWAPTHIKMGKKNTYGTIGYPIGFVKSKVVDPNSLKDIIPGTKLDLQDVPIGQPGLLLVNGPGMMKGYLDNQDETNKVFFYDKDGTRWYNTGDLVIRTGLGNNEYKFAGRQKRNFVCGVDNIYPEQIEQLVAQIPEVRDIVVTEVPDEKYQFLPVYHICLSSADVDTNKLKNKIDVLISDTLGTSALPGYINYTLEPLPRTDNGKLNAPLLREQAIEAFNNKSLALVRKKY